MIRNRPNLTRKFVGTDRRSTENALEPIYVFTRGILKRGPDNLSCLVGILSVDIIYKYDGVFRPPYVDIHNSLYVHS